MRKLGYVALGLLILFLLVQLVPYGRSHTNPSTRQEPPWPSPAVRELTVRACFDCHSNEVRWPWYSHVAPVSWLVQWDVDQGRADLNFSEWATGREQEADDLAEVVRDGSMPVWQYLILHPDGRLSGDEKDTLAAGLTTLQGSEGGGEDED